MSPVIRDSFYCPIPSNGLGVEALGHTQTDSFSCGAVAAFTVISARQWYESGRLPSLRSYRDVFKLVKPTPKWGAELKQVRRASKGDYGKLRLRSVRKQLREGNLVIAAMAWPTEQEPDMLHYVVLSAITADDRVLTLNNAGTPGRSWKWYNWADFRDGADDATLVCPM